MEDLTAVVTGASSGIGRAAAVELARRGWRVALVGRDHDRLHAAHAVVRAAAAGPEPVKVQADFASFETVRAAALTLTKLDRIDLIANNAGGVARTRKTTVDGHELTIQTNHLAPFLLTQLLRDRLGTGARIVTTASMAHTWGTPDPAGLSAGGFYSTWRSYGASKSANILFAAEGARRWPELLSFSFHPGVVRSNFGTPLARIYFRFAPGLSTPEQGADTLVHLATAPAESLTNGAYYADRKPVRPKHSLADEKLAADLWDASLTAVSPFL